MRVIDLLEVVVLVVPVLGLLLLGTAVSLRSGVAKLATGTGVRQLLGNLTSTLFVIVATFLAFLIVQRMAGFHLGAAW